MIEFFPNSREPVPEVLTADEACCYLRLDEGRDLVNARRALARLVTKRLLRPCRLGKYNRFTRLELSRMVQELTEQAATR